MNISKKKYGRIFPRGLMKKYFKYHIENGIIVLGEEVPARDW